MSWKLNPHHSSHLRSPCKKDNVVSVVAITVSWFSPYADGLRWFAGGLSGFTGRRCETNVDDCLMRPCANGATCLDAVNRFSCVCPAGFTGRFCTVNVDDCASRPCLNTGRCLDLARGFRCVCTAGFTGATCQTPPRAGDARGSSWMGGGANSSRHGDGLVKVTVSERRGAGLSRLQLTVIVAMVAATLGVAALTAVLVLQGRCRVCGHAPSAASSTRGRKTPQRGRCQISFMNSEVI
ncbi:protein delta homolog 2 [Mugil cephalus]|uniref:protein delta homolog 2 n=1 Tax=Mugil cephalus TaxID=48193 RepID=UPI001FB5882F|nr:protein delta homolog 2 [Mugil cephalus]